MAAVKVQGRRLVVADTLDLDLGVSQAAPVLDFRCVMGRFRWGLTPR
jgi:hypothetical protein